MSKLGIITEKVVETEAAKWLLSKTIGKIESVFKAVSDGDKEQGLLLRILPKTIEEKQ